MLSALFLLITIPPHSALAELWHATRPWSDGAIVMAAGIASAAIWRARQQPQFLLAVLAFGAVTLVSALVNRLPPEVALKGARETLPWMSVGILTAGVSRIGDIRRYLAVMVWTAAALAAFGIVTYVAYRAVYRPYHFPLVLHSRWQEVLLFTYRLPYFPGWRLYSTFQNENYFGVWLAMLAPVSFALALQERRPATRRFRLAATVVMAVAFTWTYSRSAVAAMLTALIVFAWRSGKPAVLLLLLPIALAWPVYATRWEQYRFSGNIRSEGGRIGQSERTIQALRANPLLGRGPGTKRQADLNYAKIAYETGLLGITAFAWAVAAAIAPGFRRGVSNAEDRVLIAALMAGLAAMLPAALGGDVWENPQLGLTFWMLAGMLAVMAPRGRADPTCDNLPRLSRTAPHS